MIALPTVDAGTLGWVKSEIEDTAREAREALASFENNTDDNSNMRMCATHLHQVYGTLTMVELDAAARLVQEAEYVAQDIADGSVAWASECGDSLRRSLDDLTNYLAGLQSPPIPSPLRLIEPINRLLAIRKQRSISEFELFSPDLSASPPEANLRGKLDPNVFLKLADDLRVRFERALLIWLRDSQDRNSLKEFGRVFTNMVSIEQRGSQRQLWWLTAALSEALMEATVETTDDTRLIFARVNEQLKLIQDISQGSKRRAPPDELIKRILLLLAHSESTNPKITEIQQAFSLREWIDTKRGDDLPDVEQVTKSLFAFMTEAESDLEQSQNLLARYFTPQGQSDDVLEHLVNRLKALHTAAERHELNVFSRLIDALLELTTALHEKSISDLDTVSLQMAGALLFIQDSASGQIRPGIEWQRQAESSVQSLMGILEGDLEEGEGPVSQETPLSGMPGGVDVTRAAATEVQGELKYVEHSLEQIATQDAKVGLLSGVDGRLKRVEGTLEILEQDDAAQLAEQLRIRLGQLKRGDLEPTTAVLDALALAVGTLNAGADSLGNSGDLSSLGESIQRAISELEAIESLAEEQGSEPALRLVDTNASSFALNEGSVESDSVQDWDLQDESLDLPSAPADLELVVDREDSLPIVDEQQAGQPADEDEEVDEIVSIFFEEANEVEQELIEKKARWSANPADREALTDLRRCFHTLKGSGRFANATAIAEISWSVEELLNAVLDGTVEGGPAIAGFVDKAHQAISPMIAAHDFRREVDLGVWQKESAELRGGSQALEIDDVIVDDLALETPAVTPADNADLELDEDLSVSVPEVSFSEPPPLPDIEVAAFAPPSEPSGDMISVFRGEVEAHADYIAECVTEARRIFPNWTITDDLLRVAHTLRGVSRSVGLDSVARMCDGLDSLLNRRGEEGGSLEEVDLVLIDQSGRLLRFALSRMDDSAKLSTDVNIQFDELANAFSQRLRFLDAHVSAQPPKPPAAAAVVESHHGEEDDELLGAFREEAQEILGRMENDLHRWERGGDPLPALSGLRRELHTLKGGARAVGWMALGDLGHNTETLLEDEDKVVSASSGVVELVQEVHDLTAVAVSAGEAVMMDDILKLSRKVLDFDGSAIEDEQPLVPSEAVVSTPPSIVETTQDADTYEGAAYSPAAAFPADAESRAVRVSTEALDELVNYAGEVSILRSRLQQQIAMVHSNINELGDTVRLFKEQLRDLEIEAEAQMLATNELLREPGSASEFDPLEMDRFSRLQTVARSLGESLNNLISVQAGITEFAGDADNTLQQQAHISDSLQDGLLRTRMIPFASVVPRLRHLTRQTSRQLARDVRINVHGGNVEVDRKILDQMSAPFEHMIRNAVFHGIEDAQQRIKLGKQAQGTIDIKMEQDGNDILIEFSDDGRGIDLNAIESRARSRGLLPADREMTDEELMRILSAPGLSTAAELTQVSGRGIGMDVVSEMIRSLGGSIAVHTEAGKGTTFSLRVPVTLAISHALLVYAGEQMFALPARLIYNVLRIPKADMLPGDGDADAYILYNDQRVPLLNLASRLGLPFHDSENEVSNVIVVRAGLREVALQVESVSDTREVVVKPLGDLLSTIPGIGAVTMLGDGSIVLILDVADLWQNRRLNVQTDAFNVSEASSGSTTVMVVDDSMTVRNVMGRDLQNNGFEVILAKDGVDAIEQLRHTIPDILLVDLEMPRMDGFELTGRVRADDNLKNLPILIITSRSGSRHRDQAMGLGASGYMSKPYRLDELVGSIQSLLSPAGADATLH